MVGCVFLGGVCDDATRGANERLHGDAVLKPTSRWRRRATPVIKSHVNLQLSADGRRKTDKFPFL